MDELQDGSSSWQVPVQNAVVEQWRLLPLLHHWQSFIAYPPQAFVADAAITTLTLTATAGSTAASLSAAPAGNKNITNWWIIPNGKTYFIRVTTHVPGSSAVTVDAVPESLTAAACVIAHMEYDLVTGTGPLTDSLWADGGGFDGYFVQILSEEELKRDFPGLPSQSWPPVCAARIGNLKIRFSHYDIMSHRVEIPYYQEFSDPSGSAALAIPTRMIPLLVELSLSIGYEFKGDGRQATADGRAGVWLSKLKDYDSLLRTGLGGGNQQRRKEPYGERTWSPYG